MEEQGWQQLGSSSVGSNSVGSSSVSVVGSSAQVEHIGRRHLTNEVLDRQLPVGLAHSPQEPPVEEVKAAPQDPQFGHY
jgi:hypothetical protein